MMRQSGSVPGHHPEYKGRSSYSPLKSQGPELVVREDPVRQGLLYAGTASSFYVSFDDGDHWHPLTLNLPRRFGYGHRCAWG
jgi:hypothetical protein